MDPQYGDATPTLGTVRGGSTMGLWGGVKPPNLSYSQGGSTIWGCNPLPKVQSGWIHNGVVGDATPYLRYSQGSSICFAAWGGAGIGLVDAFCDELKCVLVIEHTYIGIHTKLLLSIEHTDRNRIPGMHPECDFSYLF